MFRNKSTLFEPEKLPPFSPQNNQIEDIHLLKNCFYALCSRQRLPTPEKLATLELSNSLRKRNLGKQQRLLSDIRLKCREQDITDLSNTLSTKCRLQQYENVGTSKTPTSSPQGHLVPSPDSWQGSHKSFPPRSPLRKSRCSYQQIVNPRWKPPVVYNTIVLLK